MSELLNNTQIVTDKNIFVLDPFNFQEVDLNGQKYKCKLHSISVNKHFNSQWINKVERFNWIYVFRVFNSSIKDLIFYIGYNNEVTSKKVLKNDNNCEVTYSQLTQKVKTKNKRL